MPGDDMIRRIVQHDSLEERLLQGGQVYPGLLVRSSGKKINS